MKKWPFLVILFCYLNVFQLRAQVNNTLGDSIVDIAKEQLGVTYKYATCSPNKSFDCSGFTFYVYNAVGIKASRSSSGYAHLGKRVSMEEAQSGDCIVFSGTAKGSTTPGHVGIVVSNDEDGLIFIHCSSSKKHFGVVLTNYQNSGYSKRFLSVQRPY